MVTRRTAKASRAIREVVSKVILFELNDPRVKDVTVLDVEVAPDMRSAKVHVSIMGDSQAQNLTLHGLNSARGFLQKRIGQEIDTRYTPILSFVKDDSVKKSIQAARILQQLAEERAADQAARGQADSSEEAPEPLDDSDLPDAEEADAPDSVDPDAETQEYVTGDFANEPPEDPRNASPTDSEPPPPAEPDRPT